MHFYKSSCSVGFADPASGSGSGIRRGRSVSKHQTPDILHKFLSLLKIEQSHQQENQSAGKQYYPVFRGDDRPGGLIYVISRAEGIQKNIELALTKAILKDHEEDSEDYHYYGRAVPVSYNSRKHECHHTQEQNRDHHLCCHSENLEFYDHYRGEKGEEQHDQVSNHEDQDDPYQPYFVPVIGNAEQDLDRPGILIVLDTENRRIKDKEYP